MKIIVCLLFLLACKPLHRSNSIQESRLSYLPTKTAVAAIRGLLKLGIGDSDTLLEPWRHSMDLTTAESHHILSMDVKTYREIREVLSKQTVDAEFTAIKQLRTEDIDDLLEENVDDLEGYVDMYKIHTETPYPYSD